MIRHHPPSRKLLSPEMFNRESRFQPINRTRMTRIGGEQFEHWSAFWKIVVRSGKVKSAGDSIVRCGGGVDR